MTESPPFQRFPIDTEEINQLVPAFYRQVREHSELGPVFYDQIGTDANAWRTHERKIAAFWRKAILIDRDYQGNPMRSHLKIRTIQARHFGLWLDLFETVARRELAPPKADAIIALAHRIGRGLRYGVEQAKRDATSPSNL